MIIINKNCEKSQEKNKMSMFSAKMMNAITCGSKVSGYYDQMNGTTVFYSFMHYMET